MVDNSETSSPPPAESGMTTAVMVALRRIMRCIDLHSKSLEANYGLTGPQLMVLQALSSTDGMSIGSLARSVHLSGPTITGIVARLSKRALVRQARESDDRRIVRVWLTADGRKLLDKAPPLLQERFRSEFAKLSDWEQTLILSCLQRLVAMMEAGQIDASPILTTGPINAAAGPGPAKGSTDQEIQVPPGRRRRSTKPR